MQINKKEKINHANTDYSKYHMADMTDYSIYLGNLADNPPTDITIESARTFAWKFDWHEIKHNPQSGFVAFGKNGANNKLIVYYETGTVLSEMYRHGEGWTKLFRLHVDIKVMGELFENPRKHVYLGYFKPWGKLKRLEEQSWNYPSENYTLDYFIRNIDHGIHKLTKLKADLISKTVLGNTNKCKEESVVDEIEAKEILKGVKGEGISQSEEGRRNKHGEVISDYKQMMVEIACNDEETAKRGNVFIENICASSTQLKHEDAVGYRFSKDLRKFLNGIDLQYSTFLIALPSGGILYNKHEKTYWTPDIYNHEVYKLLKNNIDNNETAISESICTVAIGSMDRYFICTTHGASYWYGPKSMDSQLRNRINFSGGYGSRVELVAFGREFNSYVILYEKGLIVYCNIPEKLEYYMRKYTKSKKRWPNFISMGPSGQFFIRFTDHLWKCGGMAENDEQYLHNISATKRIKEVSFAERGIIVRYNEAGEIGDLSRESLP